MLRSFHGFTLISLGIAGACAAIPSEGDPAFEVTASAETAPVGTENEDAADDPAIWRNAADPSASLIVGTDKRAGLHVYNLAGEQISFMQGAGLNNVDLVELADGRVLAAASDRSDLENAHIRLALLDTKAGTLDEFARLPVGDGEGYGVCMGDPASDGSVDIYSAPKNGVIYHNQVRLTSAADEEGVRFESEELGEIARVPSQPEGCVVDPRSNTLYIGEEAAGIWAIDLASREKSLVAPTGTGMLVADVEGLALAPDGEDAGYLVASSQGDNAYAVYSLPGHEPLGRFRIGEGEFGSTEETDGIALDPRGFGPGFPAGLFIAQDGLNAPSAQNFKLVRWDAVLEQLAREDTAD